jgi:hypothetical protein
VHCFGVQVELWALAGWNSSREESSTAANARAAHGEDIASNSDAKFYKYSTVPIAAFANNA